MPKFNKDYLETSGSDASGWLSPEGVFWKCEFNQHFQLAEWYLTKRKSNTYDKKIEDPEQEFEKLGWIKISHGNIFYTFSSPNRKQTDVISSWWMKYHPMKNRPVNFKSLGLEEFLSYAQLVRRLQKIGNELEKINMSNFKINQIASFLINANKFVGNRSLLCGHCGHDLKIAGVRENPKHIYKLGQFFICFCKKSCLWTNSIRNENNLSQFLDGKRKFHSGFCNDLFCPNCWSYIQPLENGFKYENRSSDRFGCSNCPDNQQILLFPGKLIPESSGSAYFSDWYGSHRSLWEEHLSSQNHADGR